MLVSVAEAVSVAPLEEAPETAPVAAEPGAVWRDLLSDVNVYLGYEERECVCGMSLKV